MAKVCTVGLDMSLTSTGFCVIQKDGTIKTDVIKTTPRSAPNKLDRLKLICSEVLKRILQNEVDLVCIEDYFTPNNKQQVRAAMSLIELGTAMRLALYQMKMPFFIIAIQQLKKFATGKGNAKKSIIVREVYKKWGLEAKDDNEADACVLAQIGQALAGRAAGGEIDLLQYQEEVFEKVSEESVKYNL